MAKPSIFSIKPEDVDKVWSALSPFIKESMEYGIQTHDLDDVLKGVKDSSFALWAILGSDGKLCGAGITCVEETPKIRIAVLRWLGGNDINEWLETSLKVLAGWARLNNCTIIRSYGRKGWEKKLQPYGWKAVGSLVLLDLEDK